MKYLSRDISLNLNIKRCIGCGMCKEVCPHDVFDILNNLACIQHRESCMECGACARNCPVNAITVTSGVGCAEAIINGILTGKETCCAETECCCTGISACDASQLRSDSPAAIKPEGKDET